jgi:hypothetical protein
MLYTTNYYRDTDTDVISGMSYSTTHKPSMVIVDALSRSRFLRQESSVSLAILSLTSRNCRSGTLSSTRLPSGRIRANSQFLQFLGI